MPAPFCHSGRAMPNEPQRLRDLSPQQRKSGLAAWLGWLFDGLDMHIFTLVATAFVAILVNAETFRDGFAKTDKNGDGFLDTSEWTAEHLAAADKNHDGRVSRDEYQVYAARTHTGDAAVKEKTSWIQAAFLIGWALGG